MSVLRIFLTCVLLLVGWTPFPAAAKKFAASCGHGPCTWFQHGRACWSKTTGVTLVTTFCIGEEGKVLSSVTNLAEGEAFLASGISAPIKGKIVILGFPANGWISRSYVEECHYSFSEDSNDLRLSGCALEGDWHKAKGETP